MQARENFLERQAAKAAAEVEARKDAINLDDLLAGAHQAAMADPNSVYNAPGRGRAAGR